MELNRLKLEVLGITSLFRSLPIYAWLPSNRRVSAAEDAAEEPPSAEWLPSGPNSFPELRSFWPAPRISTHSESIYLYLYNNPSYSRILIGSCLWSI